MATKLPDRTLLRDLIDKAARRAMPDPEEPARCRCPDSVPGRCYFGERLCARCQRLISGKTP